MANSRARNVTSGRRAAKALVFALAAAAATCCAGGSQAAFFGFPIALKSQLDRINFNAPALAPMAHTRFCAQYQADCESQAMDFRLRNIALTPERLAQLTAVNRDVNREIIPQRDASSAATEIWKVAPPAGNCHDYAVTKRHELLARGWPSRALLLSEVITSWGEHHLVLVVRTKEADLVLDNLSASVRPLALTRYQWVRVESPNNPKFWSTVSIQAEQPPAGIDVAAAN
jgi:predicted transglutaminase-like cysteine proteinase